MKSELVKIGTVKRNPDNPRILKDDRFRLLVKSIKEFPEMLELRPIVVNEDMVVLGGNMRLKACKEAGLKEIPVIKASDLTDEQQKEFVVKDNTSFGEWDMEMLLESFDSNDLIDWGFDENQLDFEDEEEEKPVSLAKDISAPQYEPKNEKPSEDTLFDDFKANNIIKNINDADITDEEKAFLTKAAYRHIVFNYQEIADFYAHSSKQVQELMEESALVIIDFDDAIKHGYVELSKHLSGQWDEDYDE